MIQGLPNLKKLTILVADMNKSLIDDVVEYCPLLEEFVF